MSAVNNINPSKCCAGRSVIFPSLRCLSLTFQRVVVQFSARNHMKNIARRVHELLWTIIFAAMMYSCQRFVYVALETLR